MPLSQIAIVIFGVLVALTVAQSVMVFGFVRALRRFRRDLPSDEACPKAAVVLCLRGTDPFLEDCLQAILDQDYPQYKVRIVVDSRHDAAWPVAEKYATRSPSSQIGMEPLVDRLETCSLKCSSLVQVVRSLDDSYEFIAQLDADTIPHRSWLRELAGALEGEHVGAASGNRWYMPAAADYGSLVRYLWNAGAVVQMYWYKIAWGGTLAVKMSTIRRAKLVDHWSRAFCEDTMLFARLRPLGLQLKFAPSLMMINREACDVPGFFIWVRRQLLTARLYHPGWWAVVAHSILTTVFFILPILVAVAAQIMGDDSAMRWTLAGLIIYVTSLLLMLLCIEWAMRSIATNRGQSKKWISIQAVCKLPFAGLLTQLLYTGAVVSAMFLRRVSWRGVWYDLSGPSGVHLTEYRPFQSPTDPEQVQSL